MEIQLVGIYFGTKKKQFSEMKIWTFVFTSSMFVIIIIIGLKLRCVLSSLLQANSFARTDVFFVGITAAKLTPSKKVKVENNLRVCRN